ncbi:hypothetical protein MP228_004788 [Amoeboaphelidium protococcarum]|nr:hypothetical protein MP228_004788 [Amoeboaphelidium protococcarum]
MSLPTYQRSNKVSTRNGKRYGLRKRGQTATTSTKQRQNIIERGDSATDLKRNRTNRRRIGKSAAGVSSRSTTSAKAAINDKNEFSDEQLCQIKENHTPGFQNQSDVFEPITPDISEEEETEFDLPVNPKYDNLFTFKLIDDSERLKNTSSPDVEIKPLSLVGTLLSPFRDDHMCAKSIPDLQLSDIEFEHDDGFHYGVLNNDYGSMSLIQNNQSHATCDQLELPLADEFLNCWRLQAALDPAAPSSHLNLTKDCFHQ